MAQGFAVEWIIRPAVFEFFFEAAADLDLVFGRDRNIAAVEETMEIAPKEQAVVDGMRPAFVKGLDVCGFESRQGMFLCYRACTMVGIGNHDPESPLAEARANEHLFSISSQILHPLLGHHIARQLRQPYLDLFPKRFPGFLGGGVVLSLLDRRPPIRRNRDPFRAVKEEGLRQKDAADHEIVAAAKTFPAALDNQGPQIAERPCAVLDIESLPGQADRKSRLLEEIAPAGDMVEWAAEFK